MYARITPVIYHQKTAKANHGMHHQPYKTGRNPRLTQLSHLTLLLYELVVLMAAFDSTNDEMRHGYANWTKPRTFFVRTYSPRETIVRPPPPPPLSASLPTPAPTPATPFLRRHEERPSFCLPPQRSNIALPLTLACSTLGKKKTKTLWHNNAVLMLPTYGIKTNRLLIQCSRSCKRKGNTSFPLLRHHRERRTTSERIAEQGPPLLPLHAAASPKRADESELASRLRPFAPSF